LRVAGEQEFPVPPLAVPNGKRDVETLRTISSVALFVERAMAARPEFALDAANAGAVAEIAKRLDGLPLAIELAAARVKLLPPQTMLERLGSSLDVLESRRRDLPDRQRTLRGAISWSYDLLDDVEQRLVRTMSVFRGGATLETIEKVCHRVSGMSSDLLATLESLVDHSLIRPDEEGDEPRFGMLETIREFAWEQLQATPECPIVQEAHLDVFVEMAEQAGPRLTSAAQAGALARLDADRDNLRAAVAFAVTTGKATQAHRLVAPIWRYWHMRGLISEGRERTGAVLALDPGDPALRARTYDAAGGLAYWANDMEGADECYQRSLAEAEAAGDDQLIGFAHYNLTFPAMMRDPDRMDVELGRSHLDQAEAIFTATGDALGLASVAWGRTMVAIGLEDFAEVPELGLRANAMFEEAGDPLMAAWSMHNAELGYIRLGDLGRAIPLAEQALDGFVATGDVSGITLTLGNATFIAFTLDFDELGVRLWGAAEAIAERSGMNLLDKAASFLGLGIDEARQRIAPADYAVWRAAGGALDMDGAIELAREIISLAKRQAPHA
jgi:predicted ATPase